MYYTLLLWGFSLEVYTSIVLLELVLTFFHWTTGGDNEEEDCQQLNIDVNNPGFKITNQLSKCLMRRKWLLHIFIIGSYRVSYWLFLQPLAMVHLMFSSIKQRHVFLFFFFIQTMPFLHFIYKKKRDGKSDWSISVNKASESHFNPWMQVQAVSIKRAGCWCDIATTETHLSAGEEIVSNCSWLAPVDSWLGVTASLAC